MKFVRTASVVPISVIVFPGSVVTRVVVLTVTGLWVVILDVEKVVGLVHVSVGLVIVHRVLTGIGEIGAI